jgi:Glyoxalase superfamily protein
VANCAAAENFYCNRLGFRREFAHRGDDALPDPCYMGVTRDRVWLHISSFSGDGVFGGVANLLVDDVDALSAEFLAKGVAIAVGLSTRPGALAKCTSRTRTATAYASFKDDREFCGSELQCPACPERSEGSLEGLRHNRPWLTWIVRGSQVRGTDVRREFLVALLFVTLLHLFNRFADNRPSGVECPGAFGANPALKILSLHPYQFAAHRHHGTPRNWCGYASLKHDVWHWSSAALRRQTPFFHYPERGSVQVTSF